MRRFIFITQWILNLPGLKFIPPGIRTALEGDGQTSSPEERTLWSGREDWKKGEIVFGGREKLVGALLSILLWSALSAVVVICILGMANDDPIRWVWHTFPVIGVIALVLAFRTSARHWRYGQSTFKMLAVPGQIGGSLAGVIDVGAKIYIPRMDFISPFAASRRQKQP